MDTKRSSSYFCLSSLTISSLLSSLGTTPVIWASRNGHDTIVELLLSHGASADAVGMSNWTALLVATEGKHTKVVTKLLSMVGDGEEQGQVG